MSTLDSTVSGSSSNSFIGITEADSLFEDIFGSEKWFNFSTEEKSTLLIQATTRLQTFVFSGLKAVSGQALNWPRQAVYDYEGQVVVGIPRKLKQATVELAKWIWEEPDRNMSDTELQQFDNVKIGPMDFTPKGNAIVIPYTVNALLSSIGPGVLITNNSYRNGQVGFVR